MFLRLVACALLFNCAGLPTAISQTTREDGAAAPASAATTTQAAQSVEVAALDRALEAALATIKSLEESSELSDAALSDALKLARDAAAELARARELQRRIEALREQIDAAPDEARKARERLEAGPVAPRTELPADAPLADAQALLAAAERDLAARRTEATELDNEQKRRTERRIATPQQAAAVREQIEALSAAAAQAPPDEPAPLKSVRREWQSARERSLTLELALLDAELALDDARAAELTARRASASRDVAEAEKLVEERRGSVEAIRNRERQRVAAEAREARRRQLAAHPALVDVFRRAADLAEERGSLSDDAEEIVRLLAMLRAKRDSTRKELEGVRDLVETGALTERVGQRLRRGRDSLPDPRRYQAEITARRSRLQDVKLRLLELRSEYGDASLGERLLTDARARIESGADAAQRSEIEQTAAEQLAALTAQAVELEQAYLRLLSELSEADALQRELIGLSNTFAALIDEHVLWIRSLPAISPAEPALIWRGLTALFSPANLRNAAEVFWLETRAGPLQTGLGALALLLLLQLRPRLRRRMGELAALVESRESDGFRHTLQALAITLLLAGWRPALLWCGAQQLASPAYSTDLTLALAAGLQRGAWSLLAMEGLYVMAAPDGLGTAHFRWATRNARRLRRLLLVPLLLGTPAIVVIRTTQALGQEELLDPLGRVAFILVAALLLIFGQRTLAPRSGLIEGYLRRNAGGWLDRLRGLWYPLCLALPVTSIALAAVGYYFSAINLQRRLMDTLWLLLALLMLRALFGRWLFVAQRNLIANQEQDAAAGDEPRGDVPSGRDTPPEPALDQTKIDAQTRGLLGSMVALAFIAGAWLIWEDLLPALRFLNNYQISGPAAIAPAAVPPQTAVLGGAATQPAGIRAAPAGDAGLTLGDLLIALVIVTFVLLLGRNLPGLMELALLRRLPFDAAARFAITTVTRYVIIIAGVIFAFGQIGVGWSQVQWLAAAITFGLGFGLQEIFANFVSGLIVLFERPIRVGDTVTVGDVTGTVSRIQIRSTTITDWDRKELIIPNKDLITGRVINWTLTDSVSRVIIPVGVSYNADVRLCRRLLLKAAIENDFVLRNPRPVAFFLGFGESTLNFELRVFVADIEHLLIVRHQLNIAVLESFRQAGVSIAFPQREVLIRGMEQAASAARPGTHGEPSGPGKPAADPPQRGEHV